MDIADLLREKLNAPRSVLRGADPSRLEAMVKKSQYWHPISATCDIAKQAIGWDQATLNGNNKAAN